MTAPSLNRTVYLIVTHTKTFSLNYRHLNSLTGEMKMERYNFCRVANGHFVVSKNLGYVGRIIRHSETKEYHAFAVEAHKRQAFMKLADAKQFIRDHT